MNDGKPHSDREYAEVYLENLDARLAALGIVMQDPRTPTKELQAQWMEGLMVGLLGIGRAVLDHADATRELRKEVRDLLD